MNRYYYELYHYGVKGMKWGVRKKYKSKGRKRSKSQDKPSSDKKKKFEFTDKQKKYIKIGAAVAATALVAYGGYRLAKSGKLDGMISSGKKYLDGKIGGNIDSETGLKLQSGKLSAAANAKKVNPKFNLKDRSTFMNCGNSTIAMELRMRGYDVQALGNKNGMTWWNFVEHFKGLKSESIRSYDSDLYDLDVPEVIERMTDPSLLSKTSNAVESRLKRVISDSFSGDTARGAMIFPHANGSHWINWVKENGNVTFYDAQNPNSDLTTMFGMYVNHGAKDIGKMIRLDDLDINTDNITDVVQNVGEVWRQSGVDPSKFRGSNFTAYDPIIRQRLGL